MEKGRQSIPAIQLLGIQATESRSYRVRRSHFVCVIMLGGRSKLAFVQNDSIRIFSLETGASEKILEDKEIHCLSWSPDGLRIAYVSGNLGFVFSQFDISEALFPYIGNMAPCSIHIAFLSEKNPLQVTDDEYLNVSPAWTRDGKHLLYISNRGGARDIYALPFISSATSSRRPIRLTTGLHPHTISMTQNGQKLVYSVFNYTSNIRSIEIPEKDPLSISYSKGITSGNQIIEYAGISPDGQWLGYDSNLSGNVELYKMPVAGGEPIQLTDHPSDDFVPRWSPDGEKIAFHSFRDGNRNIYCMTKDGGSVMPLTNDPSHELAPHWSQDGSKIFFLQTEPAAMRCMSYQKRIQAGEIRSSRLFLMILRLVSQ